MIMNMAEKMPLATNFTILLNLASPTKPMNPLELAIYMPIITTIIERHPKNIDSILDIISKCFSGPGLIPDKYITQAAIISRDIIILKR